MPPTDPTTFYLTQPEPNQSCFLALRHLLLDFHPDISECTKYGMPCFCLKQKAFCYLWHDQKTKNPYLLLVDGQLLSHPLLESGNRARMKVFNLNPTEDLPVDSLALILNEALEVRNK